MPSRSQRYVLPTDVTESNKIRMSQVPSLQTLRAFEAAGRLQSYSRAAEELGLTHGAISHRVRELERRTGTALFTREGNRMVPTSNGHLLLVQVRHALQLLEQTFRRSRRSGRTMLRVSVLPALASRWLVVRLADFRAANPRIEIDLHAASDLTAIGAGGVDLGIRYGPGGWPGLQSEKLSDEVLFPVCAPSYRKRVSITSPRDLRRCTLLRNPWQPWAPWLRQANLDLAEPTSGPSYADAGLALQAAAAGEGVALARGLLAYDDLNVGTLVRLFSVDVSDAYSYFAVWHSAAQDREPIAQPFKLWLKHAIERCRG